MKKLTALILLLIGCILLVHSEVKIVTEAKAYTVDKSYRIGKVIQYGDTLTFVSDSEKFIMFNKNIKGDLTMKVKRFEQFDFYREDDLDKVPGPTKKFHLTFKQRKDEIKERSKNVDVIVEATE